MRLTLLNLDQKNARLKRLRRRAPEAAAQIDEDTRKTIRAGLIKNGMKPGVTGYEKKHWWSRSSHNWNQVCNSGMAIGALAIAEKVLGPPQVAAILNDLANLYRAQRRYAEAEPLSKRALAVLENYAALLRETGRDVEADRLDTRIKRIRAEHAKENPAK